MRLQIILQLSMKNHNKKPIPIISFFSGGGFLDMGFEQAGFPIIWTNENNEIFAKLHSYGITSWRKAKGNGLKAEIFNTQPIEDITPRQILREACQSMSNEQFGIIGGPPCQDFSSAGNNKGFAGKRGHLTEVYFDYVSTLSPLFFVFENVQNLWNNNEHQKHLKSILRGLKNDYFIDQRILNAIDFGVPQDRNRLFIIGLKKTTHFKTILTKSGFQFSWPVNDKYSNALSKYSWPRTNKFQNGVSAPSDIPLELYVNDLLIKEYQEETIPNGSEYFLPHSKKFWEIDEGDTRNRSFKRLHRFRYSPTACYGNNEVHLHPFLPRRLSVREALRIQAVDDSYVLPSDIGLTSKFKMIGNGVPVTLAYEVANSIRNFLSNKDFKS